MSLSVTILGCGSSGGVPRPSLAGWGKCNPENPKNRRRRCSILVNQESEQGSTTLLVDTSPDLREQLLSAQPSHLDAVLYTHEHADHTHGIDDLRPMVVDAQNRISIYAANQTMALLKQRFGYCFETPPGSGYPPILDSYLIEKKRVFTITGAGGSIPILPFLLHHGDIDSLGFRFGNIAYAPDVSKIPSESLEYLRGLDVLILDALRYKPHPTHLSVQEALDYISHLKPSRAILTNLHTDLDFETLTEQLPDNVEAAFDNMVINQR